MFLLFGCKGYDRDSTAGEIKEISLSDMEIMLEDGQTFVIAFTQSMCGYCIDLHEMLDVYLKNHNVIIFEVPIHKERENLSVSFKLIQDYFPDFEATPGIFYVENGECIDGIGQSQKVSEKVFDNWVKKHRLDKIKDF